MVHKVEMFTSVYLTVEIDAESREQAERLALHGDVLPRYPVVVTPADGCPPGTSVSIANKDWEVNDDDS